MTKDTIIKKTNTKTKNNFDNDNAKEKSLLSKKGLLLWAIVLIGYLLFCFDWMVLDNMKGEIGKSGWYGSFFGKGYHGGKLPGIIDQAPNWTLTFMRGVGAFFAGWVLVKIGHKYSVLIALALLCVGVVAPWAGGAIGSHPAPGQAYYGLFALFLILRMAMSVGATTLIVYTQPIIATYFKPKEKSTLNLFNSIAFNLGSMLAMVALISVAQKNWILSNWQVFTSAFSAISVVLLILWIIFSEPIATPHDPNDKTTYLTVIKEKRTIVYSIMFAFWLTWVVLYLTMVPNFFMERINVGITKWRIGGLSIILIWKILFLAGLMAAIPIYKWLSTKDWSRKPIAIGSILIGIVLTIITTLIGAYWVKPSSAFAIIMFFLISFIGGMFAWGVQGYMLGTTYFYKGATAKKQGIIIGSCWGFGYMGETVLTIISSQIDDLLDKMSSISHTTTAWIFFIIFLVYCVFTAIMWIFIPETHGKNPSKESINYKKTINA